MSLQSSIIANKVNFSSTVSTDKTCAILVGSFDAANYNTRLGDNIVFAYLYQTNIAHNFTRPAFIDIIWSTDGSTYIPGGIFNGAGDTAVNAYSDSSNIYLLTNVNTGTIYYKIIATWIDNYDTTNPLITPVLQTTNNNYFDTRQNYQKLFLASSVTVNSPGSNTTASTTIAHGLGYTPNFRMYFNSLPNQMWPSITGGGQDTWLYINTQYECYGVVDANNLTLTYTAGLTPASTMTIYYKIYYDS